MHPFTLNRRYWNQRKREYPYHLMVPNEAYRVGPKPPDVQSMASGHVLSVPLDDYTNWGFELLEDLKRYAAQLDGYKLVDWSGGSFGVTRS